MQSLAWRSAVVLGAALAASCGGGGGSFGGSDRPGASSGAITGFGSVIVNGVEWNTDAATITVDDQPGTESQLRVGQVVTIRGSVNASGTRGDADTIDFDAAIEGPISFIDPVLDRFTVLGQIIRVSGETVFDAALPERSGDGLRTPADLVAGDAVAVSGYRDAVGALWATRVQPGTAGEIEVHGVVSSLGASTFNIGTLQVNWLAVPPDFANGDLVEVEGSLSGPLLVVATKVERESGLGAESGDEGEVEGLITRFESASDFDVAGVQVHTRSGTDYEGGTSGDLALGVKVEVEGELDDAGVLVADEVQFRVQPGEAEVAVAGFASEVNASAGTLRILDLDVLVTTNAATQYEDESDVGDETFAFADVADGDYLRVRGAPGAGENEVIAVRIERRNVEDEVVLRGPVQTVADPDLVILGVLVHATALTDFFDEDEDPITALQFFTTILEGDIVEASAPAAAVSGGIMDADELEIEKLN